MGRLPPVFRNALGVIAFALFVLAAFLIFGTPGSPLGIPAAPPSAGTAPPAGATQAQSSATATATPKTVAQPSPFLTSVLLVTSTPRPTSTPPSPVRLATSTPGPRKPFKASNIAVGTKSDLGAFSGAYGAWSPDGRYYAYTKEESGWVKAADGRGGWTLQDLWLVQSDSINSHLLVKVKNASDPAWARDGSSLFYFSFEPRDLVSATNNLDLHEIRLDGTGQRVLVSGAAVSGFRQIQVMPRGDLAFVKDRRNMAIFDRASQSLQTVLTTVDLSPSVGDMGVLYAPQGDRIAYVVGRQLWLANADGSGATKVTGSVNGIWSVKWSPDGRYVAYGDAGSLWVVGRDGRGTRKVVGMEQLAAVYDARTASLGAQDWSPDGNVIFFAFSPAIRVPDSTYVVDLGGGTPQLLLANYGLYALSPAGDRAAFTFNVEDDQTTHLILTSLSY